MPTGVFWLQDKVVVSDTAMSVVNIKKEKKKWLQYFVYRERF